MAMEEKNRDYKNGDITVFWRPGKCIHSSICYTKLIEVFNPSRRPWVNMNGASSEEIISIVNKCPTEALLWKWNEEDKNTSVSETELNHIKIRRPYDYEHYGLAKDPSEPVKVKVMKNGPLVVEGSFMVRSKEGAHIKTGRFTSFCRCGQSNNMPFCDGMHRKIGYQDV